MESLRITGGDFVSERKGKLRDTYQIGKKLGDGAYGTVHKIIHRVSGEVRAVKTIKKKNLRSEEERKAFFNEVSILRSLDHPNILKIYEFYQDDKNFFLITEFCSGGELFDRITTHGAFSEAVAANYMRQILSVVKYCHERHVVHRDLKPENFLLDTESEDANLKVIDFGIAEFFTPNVVLTEKIGTPYYIAPEVLRRSYNEKCDVWSAGVNMYILLCGFSPFDGATDDVIFKKIANGRFSFPSPDWDLMSFEAKDLITKMLTFDHKKRLSASDALAHPWLKNASRTPINKASARNIFTNVRSFRSEQKLKKATYAFIASNLATKAEKEEMLELFKSLDTDNSGTLSKAELIEGFNLIYSEEIEDIEGEVDRIMHQVDTDGSGEIDYSEFVAASISKSKMLSKDRLDAAFKAFDVDGSGKISANELEDILGKHHAYDDQVWAEIIREVDSNGDGVIDLREFSEMMLRLA